MGVSFHSPPSNSTGEQDWTLASMPVSSRPISSLKPLLKTSETRKYISGSDTSTDWSQGSTYEKVDTVKSASVIWCALHPFFRHPAVSPLLVLSNTDSIFPGHSVELMVFLTSITVLASQPREVLLPMPPVSSQTRTLPFISTSR